MYHLHLKNIGFREKVFMIAANFDTENGQISDWIAEETQDGAGFKMLRKQPVCENAFSPWSTGKS